MGKILEIEKCWHCNWVLKADFAAKDDKCGKNYKIIENVNTIPLWCPLPDSKDDGLKFPMNINKNKGK